MAENIIIVGTGFSAMLAHLRLKSAAIVFGAGHKTKVQHCNQGFRYNKLFGTKAGSYTKLLNNLSRSRLHDRLVHGGNGTVWGGFINVEGLPEEPLEQLERAGLVLVPLSYKKTGSFSASCDFRQLQLQNGKTVNPAVVIKDIREGFLERFEASADGRLKLHWLAEAGTSNEAQRVTECQRLILAVGVVQLMDLLYRSGFLKSHDVLELSEFKYELRLVSKASRVKENTSTIRIGILRGLCHHLGIQYYPRTFALVDKFIPFAFEQIFYFSKNFQLFKIENGGLSEALEGKGEIFGTSIHYCNLKINGVDVNQFLGSISSKIVGVGMAFVDQKFPGPISNDIFKDVIKKTQIEE